MALSLVLANAAVNAQADAGGALLNNGKLWLYSGTKPAAADTAVTSQVLLAELGFNSVAFGAATLGVITANPITGDTSANASSLCLWFRGAKTDNTPVLDGTVGTTGTDLVMNANEIVAGATVNVSALTWTVVKK